MAVVASIRDRLGRFMGRIRGRGRTDRGPRTVVPTPPQYDWAEALHAQQMAVLPTLAALDVLVIGDSLAQHWPVDAWSPQQAYALGVGGDRTDHVLWRVERIDWTVCRPKRILIVAGTNNLLAGQEAPEIAAGIEAIASKLEAGYPGRAPFVLLPPPLGVGLPGVIATRRALRQRLLKRFGRRLVDADAALGAIGPAPNPNFQDDLIHITARGYDVLTGAVRAAYLSVPFAEDVEQPARLG